MGQTFVVPLDDSFLTSFTFWVANRPALQTPGPSRFSAYVMQWGGSTATWDPELDGSTQPFIYKSPEVVRHSTEEYPLLEQLTFDTGSLRLAPGRSYVAFLRASEYFDGEQDNFMVGVLAGGFAKQPDIYAFGTGVDLLSGDNPGVWMSEAWNDEWGGAPFELAFRATFVSQALVPEPNALNVIFSAAAWLFLVGASGILRRRWHDAARG